MILEGISTFRGELLLSLYDAFLMDIFLESNEANPYAPACLGEMACYELKIGFAFSPRKDFDWTLISSSN